MPHFSFLDLKYQVIPFVLYSFLRYFCFIFYTYIHTLYFFIIMKIINHLLVPEGTEKIITNKKSPNQK
jgi:hypothetical protein